jgi:hypothetical protein
MIICYTSEKDFYDGVRELVERQLSFAADPYDLSIVLTGGY